MAAYYHIPHPFKGQFDNGTPMLGSVTAQRLTRTLENLAKMGRLKPADLDTALNTYAAKVQSKHGRNVYTYVHPVTDVPAAAEVSAGDVQPVLRLPERVAHDLATNWTSMAYVPQRQAKSAAPVYRLIIVPMRHRRLRDVDRASDVYTLCVLDRQADRLAIYDFESAGSPGRAIDLNQFWRHVRVRIAGRKAFIMPRELNLATKLTSIAVLDALQTVYDSQHSRNGVDTMWSLLASAVHLINQSQASDPLPCIDNTIDVLTGMRTDLLPKLFTELLVTLKTQTVKELGGTSLTRALRNTYWLRKHFKVVPRRLNVLVRPLLQKAENAHELAGGTTNALCDEWHAVLDQDPEADESAASEESDAAPDSPDEEND